MGRRGKGKASKGTDASDEEPCNGLGLMISVDAPTFSMQMPQSPLAPPGLESVADSSATSGVAPLQDDSQTFRSSVLSMLNGGCDDQPGPTSWLGGRVKHTFLDFSAGEDYNEIDLPKSNTAPPEYHKLPQPDFTQLTPVGEYTAEWPDQDCLDHGGFEPRKAGSSDVVDPFFAYNDAGLSVKHTFLEVEPTQDHADCTFLTWPMAGAVHVEECEVEECLSSGSGIVDDHQLRRGNAVIQPVPLTVDFGFEVREPEYLKQRTHTVILARRSPKDKFGLAFDTKDRMVFGVMPWSPVAYWNIEHPEACVCEGDTIVSVNGVSELDGKHGLCELLMTALDVEIHVLRQPQRCHPAVKLKQGSRVKLKNLINNVKFNGATGRVLTPLGPIDGTLAWFSLALDDGVVLEVNPECVEVFVEPPKLEHDSEGEGHEQEAKTGRRRRRRRTKGSGAAAQGAPEPPCDVVIQPPPPAEEAWRSSFVRSQRAAANPAAYTDMLAFVEHYLAPIAGQ